MKITEIRVVANLPKSGVTKQLLIAADSLLCRDEIKLRDEILTVTFHHDFELGVEEGTDLYDRVIKPIREGVRLDQHLHFYVENTLIAHL